MQLTEEELSVLKLYTDQTCCIDITDRDVRVSLNSKGLIEWVPAPVWSGQHTYALTPLGHHELVKRKV